MSAFRRRAGAAVSAVTVLAVAGVTIAPPASAGPDPQPGWAAANRTGRVRLTGEVPLSVRAAVAGRADAPAELVGSHDDGAAMSLNFILPLQHTDQIDALINEQARTHQVLSRAEIYARFSPPQAQVDAVTDWLTSQGFTISHRSADRTAVAASAPTSVVEQALATTVNDYQRDGYTTDSGDDVPAYRFFSNTTNPRVPADLGIEAISGLSDVARFTADDEQGSDVSSTRSGGYWPADLRSMYDVGAHDATGQTLGFTLWGAGERQAAMTAYATTTGDQPITVDTPCVATGNDPSTPSSCVTDQPAGDHLESILENGNTDGSVGTFEFSGNVETALDIEQAHGMATHAAMKYYLSDCSAAPIAGSGLSNGGCNGTDVGLEEAVEDAANDPTLHTVSNSWGYGGDVEFGRNDPFRLATTASFQIAALAGTTFWFSTGDSGTFFSGYPSDSPYVVSVGGTSLFSTTSPATRSTATTWAGGGSWCSTIEARPDWQTGVETKAPCPGRVVPDVSAIADTNTSVRFTSSTNTTGGTQSGGVGGTSVAAPEMNGLAATTQAFLAQQVYPGGGTPPIGFQGPMIYQLGDSGQAGRYFHDVLCGDTASPSGGPDGDAAGLGWDPATGFGEEDWLHFATGYAMALGATGLSQPAVLDSPTPWTCADTSTNSSQRAVSLPTSSVGYSVGAASGGTPWAAKFLAGGSWGATNGFLETTDGGATWRATNPDMLDVACSTSSTCVEVGDGGRIRRTTNAGATWTFTDGRFDKALTSVECPSTSICYAAGERGAVVKSTDGGQTWAFTGSADGSTIYGLSCPSTLVCYGVDNYAHVDRTVDGGATWSLASTPVTTPGVNVAGSGGPNPFAGLFGISCTSVTTCVAVGGFPAVGTDPPIVTTTDAGNTWTLRTSNAGATHHLNGVACTGATCYAVGRAGTIVTSTDSGTTWTAMTSGSTSQLTGITCTSAASCVATGQTGVVDVLSGGTWTPTPAPVSSLFLAAVTCTSASSCVAAGKQGATVAFNPANVGGGQLLAGGGTTQQMNGLSCRDADHCVAVGNAGTILTTDDGGQSWVTRVNGGPNFSGVSCAGTTCEAVGAVAAGASTIVGSIDGGHSWTSQTSGATVALAGISCASGTYCVAVGSGGTILTTTDAGVTWAPAVSGVTTNLAAVTCTGASCITVGNTTGAGTTATLLTSTDGGNTWAARVSNSAQPLTAVACVSTHACFAGGAIGTVVSTTDDGATWTQQGNPISGPTSALNAGPTGITAINGAACNQVHCFFGTASAGDIMGTPLLHVTVTAHGAPGAAPALTGLAPDDASISYSPSTEAANVTGTLTCTTTATAASPAGDYPLTSCSGLSDPTYSIVYDLDASGYHVGKTDQTITFPAIPDKTYGDPTFPADASASSGLTVTYAANGDCTVALDGTVTITAAGSCTVTASQAGDATFNAAPDLARTFAIAKAAQLITFGSLSPATFGDPTFQINPTATSGLPVAVAATGPCSLDTAGAPATVTITGAGTCSITASQAGSANYLAAPDVTLHFDIAKANQTITFGVLPDRTYGDGPIDLGATASSGLPVFYSAVGQCAVSGTTLTITGAGSCTVSAGQAGDADRNPAPSVQRTFAIAKAQPGVTVTLSHPIAASDEVAVQVTTAPVSGLVSISGGGAACTAVLATSGLGSCPLVLHAGATHVVAAYQGDANHLGASGTLDTQVTKAPTTLTMTLVKRHGHSTRVVVTLHYPAGVPATGPVRITDGNGHRCRKSVQGDRVTCTLPAGTGSTKIRAHYFGDADHTSARVRK